MEFTFGAVLGILQIILQSIAVYFSYKIYQFNRLRQGWLAITFALIFMTFRRITALLIEMKYISSFVGWFAPLDRIILPFIISVLLLIGFWTMPNNFEDFEVIEKKITKKIKKK